MTLLTDRLAAGRQVGDTFNGPQGLEKLVGLGTGVGVDAWALSDSEAAEVPLTPPFQVSGNGDTANGGSNQLITSFTVPKTGTYVGTTDLFHSYSAGFTSRTSHGLAVVKAGDSVTVAANRLFYQYWQRDNPSGNTQYNLVTHGFVNAAHTNPHAAITLEVGVTYQLWRISNTGTFRDNDSAQVTFEEVETASSIIIDDQAASGYVDIGTTRIQWGTGFGANTLTFPAPFANTNYRISGNATSGTRIVRFPNKSTTGVSGVETMQHTGSFTSAAYDWIAIGLKP